MSKELYKKICDDLKSRTKWEAKQSTWYKMRHEGLRRKNLQYPGAPDYHYALADTIIEKTKPFYTQQLVSTELLASFLSSKSQPAEWTTLAARYFDYKLREESDFVLDTLYAIDHMLQSNKGILKLYWDTDAERLGCDAIEPIAIIVPGNTKRLRDADRVTHVMQMSVEQYKRNDLYNQDKDFIKRIKGKPSDGSNGVDADLEQERFRREGITESADDDIIIAWESYERVGKSSILVHTFSPNCPDEPIRSTFGLPYRHGRMPYVEFFMEIKGKGYYDPRGITEIVAEQELMCCRLINQKHQFMDFVNKPLFTSKSPLPNPGNFRLSPGQILPHEITRVDLGNPPFAFDQEIAFNRTTAEARIGQPDVGLTRPGPKGGQSNKTATEVEQTANISMQSTDMRAILFRLQLTEAFEQAWSLLLQYDQGLEFLFNKATAQLPPEARHTAYKIKPTGSVHSWNKSLQAQKAWQRFTQFKGDPFINQGELRKSVLVLDDPELVELLYQDPQIAAADQYEDEAYEIGSMINVGWPARVKESDDHAARIKCLAQFMQKKALTGDPMTDEQLNLLRTHMGQHAQMLQQSNPVAFKQLDAELRQMSIQTQQQAMMAAQAVAQPQAVPQLQAA